ncbi:hypothetical protein BKA56DRAFT_584258 [Ilyonectria sp. MPI-CAGE-AT-0026]|nr:hypothetical protein BKA56DRAFT_584258 [Ilyonectria sp. MPI-CAGE-AT-0026]
MDETHLNTEEEGILKEEKRNFIEEIRFFKEEYRALKEENGTAKEEIRALQDENGTLKEEARAIIEEKRVAKERIHELENSIRELTKESVPLREETRTDLQEGRVFKDDIESSNSESSIPADSELVEGRYGKRRRTVGTSFAAFESLGPGQDPVGSKFPWLLTVCRSFGEYRNLLSDYLQPKVSPGFVRISWTCRCGRRLRLEVPRNRQAAALALAEQASGPMNLNTISVTRSSLDEDSQSVSSSSASGSSRSSNPPLDSSGAELITTEFENSVQRRFFPRGTKMYMLLCVNTGRRLIKLANVDVTDMDDDEKVFNKLREAYGDLRKKKWYSRLVKPKTMHYIKFRLLYLQKSQECVTHYEVDSIPSIKEVMREEYLYDPCPPEHGDFPIPPDIFMHIFKYPGDHIGMATEMLPKKLYSKVCWVNSVHHSRNLPYGWGFYIVEEVDWALVAWWVFGMVILLTTLTIAWSAVTKDVQGGTGIGSYSIAALALLVSVIILGTRSIEGTVLDS